MNRYIILLLSLIVFACKDKSSDRNHIKGIKGKYFQLYKTKDEDGVLILFPGFGGGGAENTKNEFKILDKAYKRNISVLLMDFDSHVYLKKAEKERLKNELESIFKKYKIREKNIYIGGFSSGGNVSLLLSNYLLQTNSKIIPKGVFIVDSPIDLLNIYRVSEKNIIKNVNSESVEESKWIINNFDTEFGTPKKGIKNYEINSPFIFETTCINNLIYLKNIKIRLYTEPDLQWWNKHNGNDYEDLNAFSIEKMAEIMKRKNFSNVEVIKTKNKGYRANGDRHPHSWSIVNEDDLLHWMTVE